MIEFGKRLAGHFLLVARELAGGIFKRRQSVGEAINFFSMRLLTPFGFFRGWDVARSSETHPEIAPLTTNGFAVLDPLPSPDVDRLTRHFLANVDRDSGNAYSDLPEYFDHHRQERVQRPRGVLATGENDCPITQIALAHRFIDLAAEYLQIEPSRMLASASIDALIRLEQPRKVFHGYDDALAWHRDVDTYRFLKIFTFLTDVEIDGGHHEVYLHSHKHTPIRLGPIARYSKDDIETAIGDALLHQVKGPAGYTFAENTFGFHRGTQPLKADRLILNLQYLDDRFPVRYPEAFSVVRRNSLAAAA